MRITLLALYNARSYAIRGLHALLKQHGYDVNSVYYHASTYYKGMSSQGEMKQLLSRLADLKPDVLAVGVHSPVFPLFTQISGFVRKLLPDCEIVVGGEHPTAVPEDCLSYADYVVVGEGEGPMLYIAEGQAEKGVIGPYDLVTERELNALPIGYYGPGCYQEDDQDQSVVRFSYLCSRGCPFSCSYCQESVRGRLYGSCYKRVRKKTPHRVVEEIKQYRNIFPSMQTVIFSDSIFSFDEDWLDEFGNGFRKLGLRFICYGNATTVSGNTLKLLQGAGLSYFRLGVQSGSEYIRSEIFNRKDTLSDIVETARRITEHRIPSGYDFIINNPYDTADTLKETRDLIDELPRLTQINCFELRWFPNTPLTNRALQDGYIEPKDVEGQYNRFGAWDYAYTKG